MSIIEHIENKARTYYDFEHDKLVTPRIRMSVCGVGAYVYGVRKPRKTFADRKREHVAGLTKSASCRMCRYLRCAEVDYRCFGTLTYQECRTDGIGVKRDLASLVKRIFRHLNVKEIVGKYYAGDGRLFSLFWFLEFQQRGAPHFHFYSSHFISQRWLRRCWSEIRQEFSKAAIKNGCLLKPITGGQAGGVRYARKYAKKTIQKQVPENYRNVGRMWGIAGTNSMSADTMDIIADDGRLSEKDRSRIEEFTRFCGEHRLKRYDIKDAEGRVLCAIWEMREEKDSWIFKKWIKKRKDDESNLLQAK